MKETCTCTSLRAAVAVGAGFMFASTAFAGSEATSTSRGLSFSTSNAKPILDSNGNVVVKNARAAKVRDFSKKSVPQDGIAGAPCPNPDHDCFTTGTPGCSDEVCCDTICACDPFCCDTAWDINCAGTGYVAGCGALLLCDGGPVLLNDNCIDRIDAVLGSNAFTNVGATTDGPETACNGFGDPQVGSDVWFNYTAAVDGAHTVDTCGQTGLDTKISVYTGCECPVGAETACNDDTCGLQSQVTWEAVAGTCYKIRVGGFAGAQGSGTFTITEGEIAGPCGDPNNHPCDVTGGPGCSDEACCEIVCAGDAFCCQTAWDGICVNSANTLCGPPCEVAACTDNEGEPCGADTNGGCNAAAGGASGDCCVAHATPGCQDQVCQDAICACDPFCCDTQWDVNCAGQGYVAGCGAAVAPECDCTTTTSFGSIACGGTVCGTMWADANTRDTDWYQFVIDTDGTSVNWTVTSQVPSVAFILNNDCGAIVVIAASNSTCPSVAEATGCLALDAGTYVAFAAPSVFAGFPCGGTNAYTGTLTCTAPCVGDLDTDGDVDVDDLLGVINNWGACD